MKLTRFTDYALRVLIYLGLKPDSRVTIREISEAFQVSRNHLMKVVSNLTRLGYLDARRGPGGGLTLARPAREINLADVICDMEEDLNLVTCFEDPANCVISPACLLRRALSDGLSAFMATLGKYNLEDLLDPRSRLHKLLQID